MQWLCMLHMATPFIICDSNNRKDLNAEADELYFKRKSLLRRKYLAQKMLKAAGM